MTTKIPEAISETIFTLAGIKIRCYVLDDGVRVVNGDDLEAFAVMGHERLRNDTPLSDVEMPEFLAELERFKIWQQGSVH